MIIEFALRIENCLLYKNLKALEGQMLRVKTKFDRKQHAFQQSNFLEFGTQYIKKSMRILLIALLASVLLYSSSTFLIQPRNLRSEPQIKRRNLSLLGSLITSITSSLIPPATTTTKTNTVTATTAKNTTATPATTSTNTSKSTNTTTTAQNTTKPANFTTSTNTSSSASNNNSTQQKGFVALISQDTDQTTKQTTIHINLQGLFDNYNKNQFKFSEDPDGQSQMNSDNWA